MNNLLWLDVNASYQHVNVSLPALHAQADTSLPVHWERVYAVANSPMEEVIQQVVDRQPDFIMATAWLFTHAYLLSLLEDIKVLLPHTVIVLGGPEFLGPPRDNVAYLHAHPFVSFVFRGEGEEQINPLLRALLAGDGYDRVAGLCYIDPHTGEYRDNGCAQTAHFEALNPPEDSAFFDYGKAFVQLETSRGCFNSCAFCVSGRPQAVQNLPVEAVKRRLDNLQEHGVTHLRVLDRTFNAHPARAAALLELFGAYKDKMHFHLEIHPAFLSNKVLEVMAAQPSGLLHLEAGIQSLDDTVLEACGRKGTVAGALQGLELLLALKRFAVHTDLIIGLPHYTYSRLVKDTLQLMALRVDEIQMEWLKCLPGTEFRDRAAAHGLRYSAQPPYRVLETDACSYSQLNRAMVLSKIIDQWYNPPQERDLFCRAVEQYPDFLESFVDYYQTHALTRALLSKESRYMHLYAFCEAHFPLYLPQVCFYWVRNGFSLKKKPGLCFREWKAPDGGTPRRKNSRVHYVYTYVTPSGGTETYSVSFDKMQSRSEPQSWLVVKLSNLF